MITVAVDRVLVSMKTYLGDAVMTAPLLETVNRSGRGLVCLTSPLAAEALFPEPGERRFIPFATARSLRSILSQAVDLRRMAFDAVLLVNHSFRSALVARLAAIPRRIGHDCEGRGFLLTDSRKYDRDRFEALCVNELALPLGISVPDARPVLRVTDEERRVGRETVGDAAVAIQAGARWPGKQIPVETTISVARRLQSSGHAIVLIGGREEAEIAAEVESALNQRVTNLVGRTSVRQTLGCLAAVRAAVGGDTGLMHLSAAVGCPTIQVFGPTVAHKWGHDYRPNRVLHAPGGDMALVTPEEIHAAIEEALGRP